MNASVERILRDVETLSVKEREELWARVAAAQAKILDDWERQVEHDSTSGKLDHLLAELNDDINEGRTKPLNEVIKEP